jgi:hypothetical protein
MYDRLTSSDWTQIARLLPVEIEAQKSVLNTSPGVNWVERAGGLPNYVVRIVVHLMAKGMTKSHAIAVAINAIKRMCATGDLNYPGKQSVNPISRAEACAAVARWEAMKLTH